MDQNTISVHPFTKKEFVAALVEASAGSPLAPPPHQVEYLSRYCDGLKARTFVREDVYIDRHFMDEYAAYYSRMLRPPRHAVRRFHLFSIEFTESDFVKYLDASLRSTEEAERVRKMLVAHYLGFIAVRPIPSVPVGRTVLKRWEDEAGRHRDIWATTSYEVHLGSIELAIEGLAFQQQDLAVGACATAALWSALSRVARHEGMRAPTPAEVSEAAARHFLAAGRSLPAQSGLTIEQLCEAIRVCGFAPEFFRAGVMPEIFVFGLHTYLLSGIPVVLGLWDPVSGVGHAVTAVGFQSSSGPEPMLQTTVNVRSANLKKLYLHDDRIGPYAKAELHVVPVPVNGASEQLLMVKLDSELWLVQSAVAPVYPKLRLSFRSLVQLTDVCGGLMEKIVGPNRAPDLAAECQYQRAGNYLGSLTGRTSLSGAHFLRTVVLPRWCAIIRWFSAGQPVAEFVFDTTDILRDEKQYWSDLLRGVVCLDPTLAPDLAQLAGRLGVPCLA